MSDHTAALRASRTSQRMYDEIEQTRNPYPPKLPPPVSARASMNATDSFTDPSLQNPSPPLEKELKQTQGEFDQPKSASKKKKALDPIECVRGLLEMPRDRVASHLTMQDRLELRKLTETSDLESRILSNPVEFVATCTVMAALLGILLGTLFSFPDSQSPSPSLRGADHSPGNEGLSLRSSRRIVKNLMSFV